MKKLIFGFLIASMSLGSFSPQARVDVQDPTHPSSTPSDSKIFSIESEQWATIVKWILTITGGLNAFLFIPLTAKRVIDQHNRDK